MSAPAQLRDAGVVSVRRVDKGQTISIRFGTADVRDLSDGQLPAQVYRCIQMAEGNTIEEHFCEVRSPRQMGRRTRAAGRGWQNGAIKQWVEIRSGKRP